MVESKSRFLFEWILYNLIGGLSGICCGFLIFLIIAYSETAMMIYLDYLPSDFSFLLIVFFFLFAFGLGVGIAQSIKLREVEVQPSKWVIATACGCSVTSLLYALNYPHWGNRSSTISILIGAVIIGALQPFVLKKPSRIIGWWLLATVVSLVVLEFLGLQVFSLLDDFPRYFALAPLSGYFAATLFLPIPTGLVLLKYFSQTPSVKIIHIDPTAGESSDVKTG